MSSNLPTISTRAASAPASARLSSTPDPQIEILYSVDGARIISFSIPSSSSSRPSSSNGCAGDDTEIDSSLRWSSPVERTIAIGTRFMANTRGWKMIMLTQKSQELCAFIELQNRSHSSTVRKLWSQYCLGVNVGLSRMMDRASLWCRYENCKNIGESRWEIQALKKLIK